MHITVITAQQGRPLDDEMMAMALEAGQRLRGHYFGPCPYKFTHPGAR